MLQIYEEAPNFMMRTPDGEMDLYRWLGNDWGILFNHPRNFEIRTGVESSDSNPPCLEIKAFSIVHGTLKGGSFGEPEPLNFRLMTPQDNIVAAYALADHRAARDIVPRTAFLLDAQKSVRMIKLLPTIAFSEQDELADIVACAQLLQGETFEQLRTYRQETKGLWSPRPLHRAIARSSF